MVPVFIIGGIYMKQAFMLPLIMFLVLCFDLFATLYADNNYEYFQEANPIALYVWENFDTSGLIVFKFVWTLVSCCTVFFILRNGERNIRVITLTVFYSLCIILIGYWIFWFF